MHHIRKSALIPYTPAQVYGIVADIPAYPQFLPWCGGARVLNRHGDEVEAEIQVAHGRLRKPFTTRNRHQPNKMIEMRLVNGPFRFLEGFWRFEAVEGGTQVRFDLQFEFSSHLLGMVLGPFFKQATGSMVYAFQKRAQEVYGPDRVRPDQVPSLD